MRACISALAAPSFGIALAYSQSSCSVATKSGWRWLDFDAIDQIRVDDEDGTSRYYDLNGRLLPGKPQKGMYIHNGKKVIAQ